MFLGSLLQLHVSLEVALSALTAWLVVLSSWTLLLTRWLLEVRGRVDVLWGLNMAVLEDVLRGVLRRGLVRRKTDVVLSEDVESKIPDDVKDLVRVAVLRERRKLREILKHKNFVSACPHLISLIVKHVSTDAVLRMCDLLNVSPLEARVVLSAYAWKIARELQRSWRR